MSTSSNFQAKNFSMCRVNNSLQFLCRLGNQDSGGLSKGGFYQRVRCIFQTSKKKYSKSSSRTINFPPIVNNKFKFQAHDSNLEYIFEDLKNKSLFRNKSHLQQNQFACSSMLYSPINHFPIYLLRYLKIVVMLNKNNNFKQMLLSTLFCLHKQKQKVEHEIT